MVSRRTRSAASRAQGLRLPTESGRGHVSKVPADRQAKAATAKPEDGPTLLPRQTRHRLWSRHPVLWPPSASRSERRDGALAARGGGDTGQPLSGVCAPFSSRAGTRLHTEAQHGASACVLTAGSAGPAVAGEGLREHALHAGAPATARRQDTAPPSSVPSAQRGARPRPSPGPTGLRIAENWPPPEQVPTRLEEPTSIIGFCDFCPETLLMLLSLCLPDRS